MMRRLIAVLVAVVSVGAVAAPAEAASNQAVVVIDTGSNVRQVTISFEEASISGIEALERAEASPVVRGYGGLGGAVCMIDGVGYPSNPCFGPKEYWAYFRAPSGASSWSYSPSGAGATQVRDGDWEGWRWGTGSQPRLGPGATAPPAPSPSPSSGTGTGDPPAGGTTSVDGAPSTPGAPKTPSRDGKAPTTTDGPSDDAKGEEADGTRARDDRDGQDRDEDDAEVAAAVGNPTNQDGAGGGSPVGVLLALAILAALLATAVVVQRRRKTVPG